MRAGGHEARRLVQRQKSLRTRLRAAGVDFSECGEKWCGGGPVSGYRGMVVAAFGTPLLVRGDEMFMITAIAMAAWQLFTASEHRLVPWPLVHYPHALADRQAGAAEGNSLRRLSRPVRLPRRRIF